MTTDNLHPAEQELSALYETIPGIVFYVSIEADGDFRFQSVSREGLAAIGLTREQVVGSLVRDIIPPAARDKVLNYYREAIRSGQTVRYEEESIYPAGRRYAEVAVTPLFDARGVARHLIGIVHDITDRKSLETSLRESEERLRLALSSANIGFWDWDVSNGVLTWSPELYELYGVEPGTQPTYEDFSSRVHPDDLAQLEFVRDAAVRDHRQFDHEFRIIHPSGEIRWASSRGRGHYDEHGRVVRIIGNHIDITERARAKQSLSSAQEQLQRWNVELEQAVHLKTAELIQSEERLRALTMELNLAEQRERQRLAGELHDHLQQMLVLGKLMLEDGVRLADPASARVMKETDKLLSDALTYTHSLVAELSPPVLRHHGLAAGLVWLASYMKKYDIDVAVTVPVYGEPKLPNDQVTLIFQSVRELLINSSKYAGTGRADVSLEKANGRLVIVVRDEGRGVDLATINAVDSATGSASSKFGLFSIRERMRALRGSFEFASSPGKGTTAILTLPISSAHAARSDHSELETESVPRESPEHSVVSSEPGGFQRDVKIRVLLADDHVMVRQGLRRVLEGYSDMEVVGEACDGREAVELAERVTPDVIVMDINMPNLNGIDATVAIKSRHPGMRIVGLSVNADGDNQRAMLRAGAETLVSKGAGLDELYDAILQALSVTSRPL